MDDDLYRLFQYHQYQAAAMGRYENPWAPPAWSYNQNPWSEGNHYQYQPYQDRRHPYDRNPWSEGNNYRNYPHQDPPHLMPQGTGANSIPGPPRPGFELPLRPLAPAPTRACPEPIQQPAALPNTPAEPDIPVEPVVSGKPSTPLRPNDQPEATIAAAEPVIPPSKLDTPPLPELHAQAVVSAGQVTSVDEVEMDESGLTATAKKKSEKSGKSL